MSGLGGDDELDERHLLGAHQIHRLQVFYELFHFPGKQTGNGSSAPDLKREKEGKKEKPFTFFYFFICECEECEGCAVWRVL